MRHTQREKDGHRERERGGGGGGQAHKHTCAIMTTTKKLNMPRPSQTVCSTDAYTARMLEGEKEEHRKKENFGCVCVGGGEGEGG